MHQVNLNGIDLNLLPPLEALLRLRNVTEAASAVGLSQPAMSRTLARLRDLLGDPLLVRIGILLGGVVAGIALAWFTHPGRSFIAFAQEAYEESRRVTWPSRKETVQPTGMVLAFVVVMAIFLWIVDALLGDAIFRFV